ncbi:MAG: endopeptidase La [Dysgonamonadaceae bacterium]|jgi:ATP-dependent Lon protease|nr:endopeptidase La [Dysgonamonadaceae bacterium]
MTDNFTEFTDIIINTDDTPTRDLEAELPLLPLRNMIFLPGTPIPVNVSRSKSIKLVRDMQRKNGLLGTVCQKNPEQNDPVQEDFFQVGVIAKIINIIDEGTDSVTVLLQGTDRFRLDSIIATEPYLKASYTILKDILPKKGDKVVAAQMTNIKEMTFHMLSVKINPPAFVLESMRKTKDDSYIINLALTTLDVSPIQKYPVLEADNLSERLNLLLSLLDHEVQFLEIRESVRKKTQIEINKQQREYFLKQEMKNIQEALGGNTNDVEVQELWKKAAQMKLPEEARSIFEKELKKLERIHPQAPDYSMQLTYVQTITDLPWLSYTSDHFNIKRAQTVLDRDHFGLEKVKERILEHLAVLKLKGDLKSPIICLCGPPGVGKTSLGKSVAEALKRKYIRLSLGGLHDEAEIRGHRRTYIGSMPGRIIQGIKKAGSSNPVMILDEIDKVGNDYKGDPSAALLEVLDPEQNVAFHDNYLDIDYDLSKVLFIATANTLSTIAQPLLDRMEIIDISGYILEEKIEIGKKYLLPKQMENHGIPKKAFDIPKKTMEVIIESYTRESGVRELDKKIAKIMRKIARKIAGVEEYSKSLAVEELREYLGIKEYSKDKYQGNDYPGVVTGLAWTSVGGEILFVESALSKGKDGKLTITGNLGDVMKESAILALEYIKSHSALLGLDEKTIENNNIHLHVPEGATPKDGPSAGITMVTSMVSALTQRKVKPHLAMTGEITLRGKVLPIGGIKEKILAAKRAGIKEIILCEDNKKHVEEINELYLRGLQFIYVKEIKDVVKHALI